MPVREDLSPPSIMRNALGVTPNDCCLPARAPRDGRGCGMCWEGTRQYRHALIQSTANRSSRIPSYELWARRKALGASERPPFVLPLLSLPRPPPLIALRPLVVLIICT